MATTPEELFRYLGVQGIEVSTVAHPPLFTVADSQALRGTIPGAHTKNLFAKDKKGRHFLVVADEEAQIDLKALSKMLGAAGRLSFASPEAMMELLGVTPGAVTAFGVINDESRRVAVVLDRTLLSHDMVNCHPLTNEATTSLRPADLMAFFRSTGHEPLVLDLPAPEARPENPSDTQGDA